MNRTTALRLLWLLMLAHVGLALGYALLTPYRTAGMTNGQKMEDIGAPDEFAHVAYVQHIASGNGLPVLDFDRPQKGDYESHQPPLYYVLEAGILKISGEPNWSNASAGVSLRLLNPLIGAGIVAAVFCGCLWLTGGYGLAVFAAGVAALLPMLCSVDGVVSNDPLLILLCSWTLALTVRGMSTGWTVSLALGVGALAGLALLTKSTAIILLPTLVVAAALSSGKSRWCVVGAIAVAIAFAAPWWLRNEAVYHDPLALHVFQHRWPRQVHIGSPRELAHWGYVLGAGTLLSFIGEFGYMDIHLPYWIYVPLIAGLGVLLVVGVARGGGIPHAARWVVVTFVALVLLAYVNFNLSYVQPQARYIFPAIAPIGVWMALGLRRLFGVRAAAAAAATLGVLFAVNVYALYMLPREFQGRIEAGNRWLFPAPPSRPQ